ncbi:hypothetical protein CLOSYM_02761, partial [[Clostridium] symbiosum ATCC 14940]
MFKSACLRCPPFSGSLSDKAAKLLFSHKSGWKYRPLTPFFLQKPHNHYYV